MKLKRLELTNFRIFEQATFDFQPGMSLLVGINGTGKSSVLDALRLLLSRAIHESVYPDERPYNLPFTVHDFKIGQHSLIGELCFMDGSLYTAHVSQGGISPMLSQTPRNIEADGTFSGPMYQETRSTPEQPLAVYFSPRRSLPVDRESSEQGRAGGQATAHTDALSHRELRVREFVEWVSQNPREKLDDENVQILGLENVYSAVTRFLDNYTNLATVPGEGTIELLDKYERLLDIKQLSDGERGLLALILDLARRLSLANPELKDPLADGKAVVLIDELDLHLHPSWQRTIVEKLTKTFPNCQFIATTHSPQIIGECDPAGLILLTKEDGKVVVSQGGHQGFGLDSSWILEHLMGTAPRNVSVQMQINRVEDAIEEGNLQLAREHLADLRQTLHGDDGEVVRLEASINNLEALADEVDSETP